MFSSPGIRRRSLQVVRRDGALDPEGSRAYSGGMNVEEKALSTFRTEPLAPQLRPSRLRSPGKGGFAGSRLRVRHGEERLTGYAAPCMERSWCTPVQSREELKRRFVEKLGYSHCRELKKEGCVPCRDCVASAAFMAFDLQE